MCCVVCSFTAHYDWDMLRGSRRIGNDDAKFSRIHLGEHTVGRANRKQAQKFDCTRGHGHRSDVRGWQVVSV